MDKPGSVRFDGAMRRGGRTIVAAVLAVLAFPTASPAIPASGPHETVDMWSTRTKPSVSASLGYSATYHARNDPTGDPPALRWLRMDLPAGTRIDTSVLPRCTATDMEIRLAGESACPPEARIGSGEVTVKAFGAGVSTYPTVIYNAPGEMIELVLSGERVVGVVHTYVRGTTLEGPVPTCLDGGQPPDGCPSDQLTLLSNSLQVQAARTSLGAYGMTPPTCPKSRRWKIRVTLTYADGSVDKVFPRSPCRPRHRPAS